MKILIGVLLVLVMLFPNCGQKTCPCPDVVLDTQRIKFENHVTINLISPTTSSLNTAIKASGWTNGGSLDVTRTYFAIPTLSGINSQHKIIHAYFVWYGEFASFDDRKDRDTSYIYMTKAPSNTITSINWNHQPDIMPDTRIPVVPPYNRIGKVKIEVTHLINKIRNGALDNNAFLFKLKNETPYRHKTYKGLSTLTPEEAPSLELVLERPFE